jgi:hypothetical protein
LAVAALASAARLSQRSDTLAVSVSMICLLVQSRRGRPPRGKRHRPRKAAQAGNGGSLTMTATLDAVTITVAPPGPVTDASDDAALAAGAALAGAAVTAASLLPWTALAVPG